MREKEQSNIQVTHVLCPKCFTKVDTIVSNIYKNHYESTYDGYICPECTTNFLIKITFTPKITYYMRKGD